MTQTAHQGAPEWLFLRLGQAGPKLLQTALRTQSNVRDRLWVNHRRPQIRLDEKMDATGRPRIALDAVGRARVIDDKIKGQETAPVRCAREGIYPGLNGRVIDTVKRDRDRSGQLRGAINHGAKTPTLMHHTTGTVDPPRDPVLHDQMIVRL